MDCGNETIDADMTSFRFMMMIKENASLVKGSNLGVVPERESTRKVGGDVGVAKKGIGVASNKLMS